MEVGFTFWIEILLKDPHDIWKVVNYQIQKYFLLRNVPKLVFPFHLYCNNLAGKITECVRR